MDAADRRRRGHPKTTWTEVAADESEQFKYLPGGLHTAWKWEKGGLNGGDEKVMHREIKLSYVGTCIWNRTIIT